MEWTSRTIVDSNYQYPYRYELIRADDGVSVGTFDIVAKRSPGDIDGTEINADYLNPIDIFLEEIKDDLAQLGLRIEAVNTSLINAENAANSRIDSSNNRITAVENRLPLLAPLLNPVFINPTANSVPVSTNSTNLMTTAEGKKYIDGLMAEFKGVIISENG